MPTEKFSVFEENVRKRTNTNYTVAYTRATIYANNELSLQ